MPSARTAPAPPRRHSRTPPPVALATTPSQSAEPLGLRGRVRWDRIGRVSLLIVLCVVAGLYVQRALAYFAVRSQADQQRAIVQQLTRSNASLRAQQRSLNEPATILTRRPRARDGAGRRASVRGHGAAESLSAGLPAGAGGEPPVPDVPVRRRDRPLARGPAPPGPGRSARPTRARAGHRRDRGRAAPADSAARSRPTSWRATTASTGSTGASTSRCAWRPAARRLGTSRRSPARRSPATCARPATTPAARASRSSDGPRRAGGWAGLLVVVGVAVFGVVVADAADHDLILLDRHLDRPVPGPVLGVDRIVLDGGVEPQAVALLAVVERGLERGGLAPGAPPAAAPAAPALGRAALSRPRPRPRLPPRPLPLAAPRPPRARRRSARRPRPGDRSRRRSRRPRRARARRWARGPARA